jgi:NTE family protein
MSNRSHERVLRYVLPRTSRPPSRTGLVLVGGGARGAYQAGVLQGLAEILGTHMRTRPLFDVITGISAGAINAGYVASKADRMADVMGGLAALWSELDLEDVMRADIMHLLSTGSRWLRDLTFGSVLPTQRRSNHLLDTTPLRAFLAAHIDVDAIHRHVANDILCGFGVSATSYRTGAAVTFFDAHESVAPWTRSARVGRRTRIELDHILASASIPLLFPPASIDGAFYGDGGVRMTTPLSPAIHLGSDKIVAIAVQHGRGVDTTGPIPHESDAANDISIAEIAGVMLDATLLDNLDGDAEHLGRVNQTLAMIDAKRRSHHSDGLRVIPLLVIRPSVDLSAMAHDQFKRMPAMLRYLTKGIGASEGRGVEFLSYLAFDPSYTCPLIEIGRNDARSQKDEIEAFFFESTARIEAPEPRPEMTAVAHA